MADLLLVAVAIAFFAIAALYVSLCDRLVGHERIGLAPDDEATGDVDRVSR